jgi:hypothetical protein
MQAQKFHQLSGLREIELIMPVEVGEGFLKHGVDYVQTNNAKVIFRQGKPYTAFPWLHDASSGAFEGAL